MLKRKWFFRVSLGRVFPFLKRPEESFLPWRWTGKKLALFLVIMTSLIVLSYGGALLEIFSYLHAENESRMDQRVVAAIDQVNSDIEESQLGKNGYLLSGQTAYLVSYTTGIEKMVQAIEHLRQLLQERGSADILARLNTYSNMGEVDLFQASRRMERRGLMETREHFRKIQGKASMEEIIPYMKGIRAHYVQTHREMERTARKRLFRTSTLFGLSFILFASFLGVTSMRILEDLSKVNKLVSSLHHDAHHDPLTGLPNRAYVIEWLEYALASNRREKGRLAILYIDLDRFKEINDTLGHDKGDMALLEVSARFCNTLRGSDVLARLGGDEFVLLMAGYTDAETPARLAHRLLKVLEDPIVLSKETASLGASIGIAVYPEDGETPETLMKKADKAMYRSKEMGGNQVCFARGEQGLK